MWLRDWLPKDVSGLRILTYGYDSTLSKSKSFQDLEALASKFRTTLRTIRQRTVSEARRGVMFCSHSQ